MVSGISSSVAGLQAATNRIDKAAANIAKSGTQQNANGTTVQNDPTTDIIDLTVAKHDFEANLKAFEVQDKVTQSLLDILT